MVQTFSSLGYTEVQYQGTWVGCYAAQVWVAETELLPGGGSSPISSPNFPHRVLIREKLEGGGPSMSNPLKCLTSGRALVLTSEYHSNKNRFVEGKRSWNPDGVADMVGHGHYTL